MTETEATRLLVWYDRESRDLPWRKQQDPYSVWVSEIMLQQTQVKTVIPYFEAFMRRFPTIHALAEAPLDEVLARWSGLGYYRRARQLHRAAREIEEVWNGEFPTSSRELQSLPGIGPYTAAAVASIAFGEKVPVLDGNVERVLCRRMRFSEDPKKAASRRKLSEGAAALLDPKRPGDSNQALMELGAMVCRPVNPDCSTCPLAAGCGAWKENEVELYPVPRPRRKVERMRRVAALVYEEGKILLFRRPDDAGLMAGLWELPNVSKESTKGESEVEGRLAAKYGGEWKLSRQHGTIRHGITYRALTIQVQSAQFFAGGTLAEGPEAAWVSLGEISEFAVSSMVDKALGVAGLR